MVNMESDLAIWIEGVNVAWACPAKLTSKAVSFKNLISQLRADCTGNDRFLIDGFKYIFTGLQVRSVNVGLDLKTFLVTQLAYASGVFTYSSYFPDFLRSQNLARQASFQVRLGDPSSNGIDRGHRAGCLEIQAAFARCFCGDVCRAEKFHSSAARQTTARSSAN